MCESRARKLLTIDDGNTEVNKTHSQVGVGLTVGSIVKELLRK